jgi:hypothetical protein
MQLLITTPDQTLSAQIRVQNGQLSVDGDNPDFCNELIETISGRYFIQGQGFPVFEKDEQGQFIYASETGKLSLKGFVDMAAPDHEILQAIQENFRVGQQYQIELSE